MATVRHLGLFPILQIAGSKVCAVSSSSSDGSVPEYGPGTLYPVAMSLRSVMALYWKIKTWTFTHTLDGNNQDQQAVAQYETPPVSEKDLVCGFAAGTNTRTIEYAMTTEATYGGEVSISAMTLFGYGQKGPFILRVGQDLYPRLQIAWEGPIRYFEQSQSFKALESSSRQSQGYGQNGQMTLDVLGEEYEVAMYSPNSYSFYSGQVASAAVWEYAD